MMVRKRKKKNPPTNALTITGNDDNTSKKIKIPLVTNSATAAAAAASTKIIGCSTNNSVEANGDTGLEQQYMEYIVCREPCPSGGQEYGKHNITTAIQAQTPKVPPKNKQKTKKPKSKTMSQPKKSSGSANDGSDSTKSILFLEEQVKIHEATLRAWRQRREAILVETEASLVKKRELIDLRTTLIDRQKTLEVARSKHLVLQEELTESLAMSHEKLKRLTMIEHEVADDKQEESSRKDVVVDSTDDMDGSWVYTDELVRASSETSCELSGVESTIETIISPQTNPANNKTSSPGTDVNYPTNKSQLFPIVFDSYKNPKELARYHNSGTTEVSRNSHRSLSGFLPYLDATQVGDYLTIMLRETYALDQQKHRVDDDVNVGGDSKCNSEYKERSLRRKLLQNTCLDVLLLAPPLDKNKDGAQLCDTSAYSDLTQQLFDPSISLCPYELAGICADDLCPYQHTTKATKILARERLPLPSLPSFFLSVIAAATPKNQAQPKPDTYEKSTIDSTNQREAVMQKQTDTEAEYQATLTNYRDNTGEEEGFIMLPPSSSPNNDKIDNNIDSNNNDTASYVDADNEKEEEDLIILPSSRSPNFEGKNNQYGNEDETNSNSDCRSSEDSDYESEEGLLPLSTTLTRRGNSECKPNNTSSFWWGGKLSIFQDNRTEEMVPKDSKSTALSILDVLEDTFGIAIHEYLEMTMPGAEESSSSPERRLEIKSIIDSDRKESNEIELIDDLKVLGRMMDASRLAIHGGLHGVAITLSQELLAITLYQEEQLGRNLLMDESLQGFAYLLRVQTEVSRFYDEAAQSLSCFEVAFATQVGLSILSWSVAAYGKAEEIQKGKNHRQAHFLESACKNCLDLLRNPARGTNANTTFEPLDTIQLAKCLRNDCFSDVHLEIDHNGTDAFIINTAASKVDDLRYLVSWARRHLIPHCEEIDASEQPLEERLNSVWLVAKIFLREHRQGYERDESSGDSPLVVDTLDWELQCLKVVILMGYAISGCLSNFAYAAVKPTPTETDCGGKGVLESKLSASTLAAWTLLDGAIARVLKGMRKILIGFPLLDLVLAPLCSYSVASASFLRNYSTAQNRLVEYLSGNHRRSGGTSVHPSRNLMSYSELLWSQLVQLRMSLPNEYPEMTNQPVLGGNFMPKDNKLLTKRDAAEDFPWEPSKTLKEKNLQFVAKLMSLGIRLRHVVLWGDRILSSLTGNNGSGQTLLRLFSQNRSGLGSGHNSTNMPICIRWREDLDKSFRQNGKNKSMTANNPADQSFGSGRYPPLLPLPQLPLFLLYAGKFLTTLNCKGCSLGKIPLAFGLYFPNLRTLDLSHNNLRELPESFRRLAHRMKFLEEFRACHNNLESLPSDMLSAASIAASSKQSTSSSQPPLRILDLSHNKLVSLPSLVGLDHLEVLELRHNALVDMSVADWSKLALRLPSLRVLKNEHQAKRELLPREEWLYF